MPFLRDIDYPPFYVVEEILNFADQILEVTTSAPLSKFNPS